jgi:hypothetical protein
MSKQLPVNEEDGSTKSDDTYYYLIVVRNPLSDSELPNRAFAA